MAKAEGQPQIKDDPATPTVNEAAVLAIPFTLSSGKTGKFYVVQAQVEYYNIVTTGAANTGVAGYTRVSRKGGTKTVYNDLKVGSTGTARTIRASDFYLPTRLNGAVGGKAIVIPTRLRRGNDDKKGFRTTSMRVTGSGLILADISAWLAANLKANEPAWFQTENGGRYAVVPRGTITDLNPGRNATAPTAG